MNMVDAVKVCFEKYGVFSGRASRTEFWFFQLASAIIFILVSLIFNGLSGSGVGLGASFIILLLYSFFYPAFFVLVGSVSSRRMHDVAKNGWYVLIPIYGLILACTPGVGDNEYGPALN